MELPNQKYSIIYADPPWSYYNDMTVNLEKNKSGDGSMKQPPYPVMSSKDISEIGVNDITEENALLFIWTTDYHLEKCMGVIESWGFEYKTVGFVWQKLNKSGDPVCFMGAYTMKSGVENCLLATKGKDSHKLVQKHNVRSLIQSPRSHHSKKPDEVRDRIVDLVGGEVKKIELFARDRFDGWDSWGNELK